MKIHNLTQHLATQEQICDGVTDFTPVQQQELHTLLTFDELPDAGTLQARAEELANWAVAHGVTAAMLGGAPFFMSALVAQLQSRGIRTFFAYSRRRSTEYRRENGEVEKHSSFVYEGMVEIHSMGA